MDVRRRDGGRAVSCRRRVCLSCFERDSGSSAGGGGGVGGVCGGLVLGGLEAAGGADHPHPRGHLVFGVYRQVVGPVGSLDVKHELILVLSVLSCQSNVHLDTK